ncbi:MAG: murein L,D-transpeptidase catalytic domain family protein [Lentimicrobium sp.]|jgi:hypothetical protein|nr:murein L,D-transpeptidase catalytic domain family protein [Lentimicrobium sp.]
MVNGRISERSTFLSFKSLKIIILTAVLVFAQQLPAREKSGSLLKGGLPQAEVIQLLSFSGIISPALINSFRKHLADFLPYTKTHVVTLIDFSLPSTVKRLWTINLQTGELLLNTYVAHGRNSGDNEARQFSNVPESYQSSLGFYLTDQVYVGKHGNSMRLRGLEKNINDKAWDRAIVVHGADYATDGFIRKYGRLGRSFGCPAIPPEVTDEFIQTVKDGSLLFIYHPRYEKNQA